MPRLDNTKKATYFLKVKLSIENNFLISTILISQPDSALSQCFKALHLHHCYREVHKHTKHVSISFKATFRNTAYIHVVITSGITFTRSQATFSGQMSTTTHTKNTLNKLKTTI